MIIVVEGHSSPVAGSEVAAQLADYLKYTLINQEDVAPTLQGHLSSSFNQAPPAVPQDLDNLSFKIVYQIASAQLRSKLGVVIYLPQSNHAHFDQLKQLANLHAVELLSVQCRSHDEIVDDDAGGVRKLTVDTSKQPFDVEGFVSAHLGRTSAQSLDPDPKPAKKGETYKHLHCLALYNKPTNDAARLRCKGCGDLISGPNYRCPVCDEYIFHKSCAEIPGDLVKTGDACPPSLISKDPEYRFSEKRMCKACAKTQRVFSDGCHDCLFETTIRGKLLPAIVNHEAHLHPLNLIIMPLSYNYVYGCCGCGEIGKSISYRCFDCNFNLHVSCVLANHIVEANCHQHPLRLAYASSDENVGDQRYCDVCEQERNPGQWFYTCAICDFVAHMGCAAS